MDTDADLDAAAEDPPVLWLTVAVVGLVCTGAGLLAFVAGLLNASGPILDLAPFLTPLFGLSPFVALLGVVLFLFAMTEWSPDLDT